MKRKQKNILNFKENKESQRNPLSVMNTLETPQFIVPNESAKTKKGIPAKKTDTSYSRTDTLYDYNDSSMIEKHTIIFESDNEQPDIKSNAPTESQYVRDKHTIHFEDSSCVEGGAPLKNEDERSESHPSSVVDSSKPPQFNDHQSSGNNLATFRKNGINQRSQSDIYHNDINLDELYNDPRASRTANENSRMPVKDSQETMKKVYHNDLKSDYQPQDDILIQDQLDKLGISGPDKDKLNDEIYLNTNSAEENPDLVDEIPKDSESLSKHTL